MRIPKRFELHLACGEDTEALRLHVIRVVGGRLCASDGVVVAAVPVGPGGVTREPGEELLEGAQVEPDAWRNAVHGSKGEGTLRLTFDAQLSQAAPDKPELRYPAPDRKSPTQELPPVGAALAEARHVDHADAEIILDAEALLRLQRALGASEGVRIRFPIGDHGRCSAAVALVEPAEGGGAFGAIMPIVREGHG